MKKVDYLYYLRKDKFPNIWCPGCGHGIALKALIRGIDELGLKKDDVVLVSGIGCSSRATGYVDFNTLHTTHGRAIAFATGVKLTKPHLKVIVISGDGDAVAIGGNHFIHAARRNIDISLFVWNNNIYGMTGGQVSPTTDRGRRASTAPFGAIDPPFDICELAIGSGATFVARGDVYHANLLDKIVQGALNNKGFSVVEIYSPCYTAFGRRNRFRSPIEMYLWLKDNYIPKARWDKMSPEEREGKVPIGVFLEKKKPEYCEEYQKLVNSLKGEK